MRRPIPTRPNGPRPATQGPAAAGRLARRPFETLPDKRAGERTGARPLSGRWPSGGTPPAAPCSAPQGGLRSGALFGMAPGPRWAPRRRPAHRRPLQGSGRRWSPRGPCSATAPGPLGLEAVFQRAQGPRLGRAAPRRLGVGPAFGASPRRVTAPGGLSLAPRIEFEFAAAAPPGARPAGRAGALAWARRHRLRSAARAPPVCGLPRGGSPLRVCAPASARLRSMPGVLPAAILWRGARLLRRWGWRGLARPSRGRDFGRVRASPPQRLFGD